MDRNMLDGQEPGHGPRTGPTPATERMLGDERSRYGRRSVRDQLVEVSDTVRAHPVAVIVAGVIIGLLVLNQAITPSPVSVAQLRVGDCLYVRTDAAQDVGPGSRPIGTPSQVEEALMTGNAERTACGASHGHEVSAIVPLTLPLPSGAAPTQDQLRSYAMTTCQRVFPGYVGHPLAGSIYETFAAVPTSAAWMAGGLDGVCLIARIDGQWMTQSARASGG